MEDKKLRQETPGPKGPKWGDMELNILDYSYRNFTRSREVAEIMLLPGADGRKDSVLQAGPVTRRKAGFTGAVLDLAEYYKLEQDQVDGTPRVFTPENGQAIECIILSLSEPTEKGPYWEYTAEVIEI